MLALAMAGLLSLALRSTSIYIFDKRIQLVLLTILGVSFYGAMALWLIRAQVLSFRTFFKIPEFRREAFDDSLGVRIAFRETEEHRKTRV
jgi:hypothetical protein